MRWTFLCSVLAEQLGVFGRKDHRHHCGMQLKVSKEYISSPVYAKLYVFFYFLYDQ